MAERSVVQKGSTAVVATIAAQSHYQLVIPEIWVDNFQQEDKSADIIPHNMRGGCGTVKDLIWSIKIYCRHGTM